ncbi:hypothetical protein Val02_73800 [Virgisporangium aliadipatigenens]|uniref:Uncharacterized protein n=1 Tax=Virgisporangium aliadipatigenens TaxID=741659 RepID=A0A8J3YRG8_9ACTN|nr:hypothetical protein [Virgisporangium aliadipatigenens]GIJ50494.1 hypothetical protein Val02_73800 [Virgisporangium aliadipatigenens]
MRHLAHLVEHRADIDSSSATYALQPIDAPRPAAGESTVEVTCATCGRPVELTVLSAAALRRRRARLRAGVVALYLAAALCAIVGVVTFGVIAARDLRSGAAGWTVVGMLFGTIVLGWIAHTYRHEHADEDGLRIAPGSGHSLRPAGDTGYHQYHLDTAGGGE